jgi:hypothetical protein
LKNSPEGHDQHQDHYDNLYELIRAELVFSVAGVVLGALLRIGMFQAAHCEKISKKKKSRIFSPKLTCAVRFETVAPFQLVQPPVYPLQLVDSSLEIIRHFAQLLHRPYVLHEDALLVHHQEVVDGGAVLEDEVAGRSHRFGEDLGHLLSYDAGVGTLTVATQLRRERRFVVIPGKRAQIELERLDWCENATGRLVG